MTNDVINHHNNVEQLMNLYEQEVAFLGKLRALLTERMNERRSKFGNLDLDTYVQEALYDYPKYYGNITVRIQGNLLRGDFLDAVNLWILGWYVRHYMEKEGINVEVLVNAEQSKDGR